MSDPVTAREALIIETIGEAAVLIDTIQRVAPDIREACREIARASASLHQSVDAYQGRMAAITEHAKVQTLKYVAARTEEAARRSIDQQSQAMAEAARVAFAAQLGAPMERLQAMLRPLIQRQERRWETWLTHAAAAWLGAAVTWAVAITLFIR